MSGWKDYFHFQKIERQGLFVLIALIVVVIVAINALDFFHSPSKNDFSEFQAQIKAFETALENKKTSTSNKVVEKESVNESILFEFDPNNLPISDWIKLGLSRKQAETIKKYEEKGGSFTDKQDVKKMYTISPELYSKLEKYILLPEQLNEENNNTKTWSGESKKYKSKAKFKLPIIDINIADTSELMKIKGVGPAYSSRIVKYRNSLGGFYTKEQILEVWGIDSILYEKISNQIVLQNVDIQKININSATTDDLKNHPYIDWKIANSIYKYRMQNGNYQRIEDIKNSHLIDHALFDKLRPYLKVK